MTSSVPLKFKCIFITYLLTTDVLYAYLHLLRRSLPSPCNAARVELPTVTTDRAQSPSPGATARNPPSLTPPSAAPI
ncbi:hypothetical protein B0H14DRAFT_3463739 [Mycena olivaceomarginata]|nr:hypothetical protein B0H14DRAFT_3463739 [Mycena olivaceomarginata]